MSSQRRVQEQWHRLCEPVSLGQQRRRRRAAHLRGLAACGVEEREETGKACEPVPEGSGEG